MLSKAKDALHFEAACAAASQVFEGWSDAAVEAIYEGAYGWSGIDMDDFPEGRDPESEAGRARIVMAHVMLREAAEVGEFTSAALFLSQLAEAAKKIGVKKLPKSLEKMAAEFDIEIKSVAAETGKAKK